LHECFSSIALLQRIEGCHQAGFLAPATDGRSFDVQALNAQLWLNLRQPEKSFAWFNRASSPGAPQSLVYPSQLTPRSASLKQALPLQTLRQRVHLSQRVYPYLSAPDDGGIKDIPAFIAVTVT
jgi:hypothetical protein